MWWLQLRHSALARLLAVSALVTANSVVASTITFDGLAGSGGNPFTSYTESGFTVSDNTGSAFAGPLVVGEAFGNLVPSIFGTGPTGSILVTSASGLFSFGSIDLAGNNGDSSYIIAGTKTGAIGAVFTINGSVSGSGFDTVLNSNLALIDSLSVTIIGGTATSFNIDNIGVSAVPVPAAVWLFGSGLVGLAGFARKRA